MTNEQRQEHIQKVNHAIQILNKQITNLCYTQARMTESIGALFIFDDDTIRQKRRHLDDDFFVAEKIIAEDLNQNG